ncbi:hypothetical protein FNV43_RR10958 [Rhamnella rubrinervis]|uniref:Uncharacterized protein n=1 Tax=Rhamnella rubrinervis TaxID=2594499 RepID=A0A8K0H4X0_9ROSA|nr:hypothetical protein FNV43_RR10958 [Rhamnella rubrinervis]
MAAVDIAKEVDYVGVDQSEEKRHGNFIALTWCFLPAPCGLVIQATLDTLDIPQRPQSFLNSVMATYSYESVSVTQTNSAFSVSSSAAKVENSDTARYRLVSKLDEGFFFLYGALIYPKYHTFDSIQTMIEDAHSLTIWLSYRVLVGQRIVQEKVILTHRWS